MERIALGGYVVRLEEEDQVLTWQATRTHIVAAIVWSVVAFLIAGLWGYGLTIGAVSGGVEFNGRPLAGLMGIQRLAGYGFVTLLLVMGMYLIAASAGTVFGLLRFLVRETGLFAADRRSGRFLRGHRDLGPLDQVGAVGLVKDRDAEGDSIWLFELRLGDASGRTWPHFSTTFHRAEDAARFASAFAEFLGVPVETTRSSGRRALSKPLRKWVRRTALRAVVSLSGWALAAGLLWAAASAAGLGWAFRGSRGPLFVGLAVGLGVAASVLRSQRDDPREWESEP
ncbi:MAG TPA: hypothetical protein VGH33_26250 [Isosphaeraceae bacterium]